MSFQSVNATVTAHPPARLVVVAKNRSVAETQSVVDAGADTLAFNRVQEATEKFPALNFTGERHLIGHLQRNKATAAVALFDLIHSIDSQRVALAVDRVAGKAGKRQCVLLQVNTAADPDKYGFSPDELRAALPALRTLNHLQIDGLMMIGARVGDPTAAFCQLRGLADELALREVSMGMSGDYQLALDCGATLVRVGSACFQSE